MSFKAIGNDEGFAPFQIYEFYISIVFLYVQRKASLSVVAKGYSTYVAMNL